LLFHVVYVVISEFEFVKQLVTDFVYSFKKVFLRYLA